MSIFAELIEDRKIIRYSFVNQKLRVECGIFLRYVLVYFWIALDARFLLLKQCLDKTSITLQV